MNLSVDMMLSSPADRALETAHSFAPLLSFPVHRIRIASVLYVPGSVRQIMSRLRALPDDVRTVAVVGHNPSLEDLSAYLVRDYSGGLPKGAVAGVAVNTRAWAQLRKGTASLQFLVTPLDSGKKAPARRRPLR
jgi:phosphohistidine phosphatase